MSAEGAAAMAAVLGALRTPGRETELTRSLSAFAGADRSFAAQLARVFAEAAPFVDDNAPGLREAIDLPAECLAEQRLDVGAFFSKAIDLAFLGPSWALLAELKIYSPYHHGQLDNYLAGGARLGREPWGLVGVVREADESAPKPPDGTPHWLGSILWREIVQDLRQIRPADASLARAWQAFLDVEIENRDFGVTTIDAEILRAWATWRKATTQLKDLLGDLEAPTLAALRRHLPEELTCSLLRGAYADAPETVSARFSVPEQGRERLRIEFDPLDGELVFWVSAIADHLTELSSDSRDQYARIVQELREKEGFEEDPKLPPGTCVSHWYPAKLWLVDDAEVTAANLMDFVDTDIGVLCEAELFSPRFDP